MADFPFRRAAVAGLKRGAVLADGLRSVPRGIVVLAYHRVGRRTSVSVDLPDWLFEEQIGRLADGPGVVDLDSALAALASPPSESGVDPLVVTFDDGTADFVEVALPILVRHRVPAVLYVATDFVETGRYFPDEGKPASWAALKDAVSTGLVGIGSHTHTHALLDRTPPGEVAMELDRSIDLIGERLGVRANHFAHPKAIAGSPAAEREVRSRFCSAALAGTRTNPYLRTDVFALARSPVQVEDGLRFFDHKVRGGMRLEADVRRWTARWRFAGAAT